MRLTFVDSAFRLISSASSLLDCIAWSGMENVSNMHYNEESCCLPWRRHVTLYHPIISIPISISVFAFTRQSQGHSRAVEPFAIVLSDRLTSLVHDVSQRQSRQRFRSSSYRATHRTRSETHYSQTRCALCSSLILWILWLRFVFQIANLVGAGQDKLTTAKGIVDNAAGGKCLLRSPSAIWVVSWTSHSGGC